jgi:AbrB family looped-hinge helix DNA binding protein
MRERIGTSIIDANGRVTIPKQMRDYLHLETSDKIVFIARNNETIFHKATTKKLSTILENQRPWKLSSSEFQRKARKEWSRQ